MRSVINEVMWMRRTPIYEQGDQIVRSTQRLPAWRELVQAETQMVLWYVREGTRFYYSYLTPSVLSHTTWKILKRPHMSSYMYVADAPGVHHEGVHQVTVEEELM
jgi:hypothetical protein